MIIALAYQFHILHLTREEWEGSSHISYNLVDHLLIFLALVDRTLLLSNYLGNSFPQTEQLPKPELPSHSSLVLPPPWNWRYYLGCWSLLLTAHFREITLSIDHSSNPVGTSFWASWRHSPAGGCVDRWTSGHSIGRRQTQSLVGNPSRRLSNVFIISIFPKSTHFDRIRLNWI